MKGKVMKTISFYSLAEFKRACVKGNYIKGGYFHFARGEKNRGVWREIAGSQSNACKLKTEGVLGGSWFYFPKASECEIEQGASGSVLKIYEERVKVGGNDLRADTSWLKYDLEQGKYQESDLERYRKQVAEYQVGENE